MRLIDADAFIEFLRDTCKQQGYSKLNLGITITVGDVIDAIISELDGSSFDGFANAPTVDIGVIQCKDCKYYDRNRCELHEYRHFNENDFCSYAKMI